MSNSKQSFSNSTGEPTVNLLDYLLTSVKQKLIVAEKQFYCKQCLLLLTTINSGDIDLKLSNKQFIFPENNLNSNFKILNKIVCCQRCNHPIGQTVDNHKHILVSAYQLVIRLKDNNDLNLFLHH